MTFLRVLLATLKEIFDESAYERFCAREGVEVSCESYSHFLMESDAARQQNVRCC
jgi:hypothetical protein